MCKFFSTNVDMSENNQKWRAGDLKFLVRLKKLVERRGVRFGLTSKLHDFTWPSICLLETQSSTKNGNLNLVIFSLQKMLTFFPDGWGKVLKKEGYFTVTLIVRVDPPLRSGVLCFFWGVHLTLVYDYTWVETDKCPKTHFQWLTGNR